jgi:tellurite resistance protein TehA-like permease
VNHDVAAFDMLTRALFAFACFVWAVVIIGYLLTRGKK